MQTPGSLKLPAICWHWDGLIVHEGMPGTLPDSWYEILRTDRLVHARPKGYFWKRVGGICFRSSLRRPDKCRPSQAEAAKSVLPISSLPPIAIPSPRLLQISWSVQGVQRVGLPRNLSKAAWHINRITEPSNPEVRFGEIRLFAKSNTVQLACAGLPSAHI
jgi:hypothetical protein